MFGKYLLFWFLIKIFELRYVYKNILKFLVDGGF